MLLNTVYQMLFKPFGCWISTQLNIRKPITCTDWSNWKDRNASANTCKLVRLYRNLSHPDNEKLQSQLLLRGLAEVGWGMKGFSTIHKGLKWTNTLLAFREVRQAWDLEHRTLEVSMLREVLVLCALMMSQLHLFEHESNRKCVTVLEILQSEPCDLVVVSTEIVWPLPGPLGLVARSFSVDELRAFDSLSTKAVKEFKSCLAERFGGIHRGKENICFLLCSKLKGTLICFSRTTISNLSVGRNGRDNHVSAGRWWGLQTLELLNIHNQFHQIIHRGILNVLLVECFSYHGGEGYWAHSSSDVWACKGAKKQKRRKRGKRGK